MSRVDVFRMVKRRVRRAEIGVAANCHTFWATGITAYLLNGGSVENAQAIAAHESPRTTKLYDRTADEISLDEPAPPGEKCGQAQYNEYSASGPHFVVSSPDRATGPQVSGKSRERMRIAMGSDHAGFGLKEQIKRFVQDQGHEVRDYGTHDAAPVDYPDFAEKVGLALRKAEADRGIVVCGSGVGASVAANKLPGIRAGVCHDTYSAHQGVEHDDMNVLVLGARIVGVELAREVVLAYLGARFTGEERHRRRLGKVESLEARYR